MQFTPDERLDAARNQIGQCRQQITRLPENPSQRAALALADEGLRLLATLPKYPPSVPGEASLFFEGASLEDAVEQVLEAAFHGGPVPEKTITDVASRLAGGFSDAELNILSGQAPAPLKPRATQTGFIFGRKPAS